MEGGWAVLPRSKAARALHSLRRLAVAVIRADIGDVQVLLSDGFKDLRESGFTQILCNPPYHTEFRTPKHFIHKGFNRLVVGGKLWMVTQRQAWYRNKLRAIFGRVLEHSIPPYTVFEATKISPRYANAT
jgi:16S rRNA (guanine1207-N2)-methyltransferase